MSQYVRRTDSADFRIHSRLPSLDIELTERCNNDCVHCCINLPLADPRARDCEMSTRQITDLLDQAADLGCIQVRLTGGEPLLREDFEDVYVHARRKGLKVRVFTNARNITERIADLWARIPPLVLPEITVYGMHRESYESVSRVPGSYEQFRRGLDMLLDRGVAFIVKGVLLPSNRSELPEFEAWAQTLPGMDKAPGQSMFFDLRHRRDDPDKNKRIRSLRISPEEGLNVMTRDEPMYRRRVAEFVKFMGSSGDLLFDCAAGRTICVDAYGHIQPCLSLRAPELTVSASMASLADALDRYRTLRDIRAVNPDYLRRCAHCFLKGLCEQCPAKSWAESGTLDTPVEYLCEVAHEQARYLRWLRRGERAWEVEDSTQRIDEAYRTS